MSLLIMFLKKYAGASFELLARILSRNNIDNLVMLLDLKILEI
jgi:hypothetical protein